MTHHHILADVLIFLAAAVGVVPLLQYARVPAIVGYLLAGVLVGPHVLGLVRETEVIHAAGELGVVFLLFTIGLELSLERFRGMGRLIFGVGVLQLFPTAAVLGAVAHLFLGLPVQEAFIVGSALGLSSTAFVMQILTERGDHVTRYGRVALAILLLQDIAVVPLLALLPLLDASGASLAQAMGVALLKGVGALLAIWLVGRLLLRPLYRLVAQKHAELFVAATLLVVLGSGWFLTQAGLSMALGAFLCGLMLAESEYRHQVAADIRPFKGLLLGLFFMVVGVGMNLPLMAGQLPFILLCLLFLLAVKLVMTWGACRLFRLPQAPALRVGVLLAQAGEFAFVIFALSLQLGLLQLDIVQLLTAVVALGMLATPFLDWVGGRLFSQVQHENGARLRPHESSAEDVAGHVVIAGFGRVGQTVARILTSYHIPYIALDMDTTRVATCRARGLPVFYGDASDLGLLKKVGAARARAAVITMNSAEAVEKTVAVLHQAHPELPLVARARHGKHARALGKAGATAVIPDTLEASLSLSGMTLAASGIPEEEINRLLGDFRQNRYASLEDVD